METMAMTDEMGMDEILAQNPDTTPGEVVEGTVVSRTDSHVIANVGLKQEASIPLKEFGPQVPSVGEKIPLLLIRVNGPEGRPLVSWRQAREKKYWDLVAEAHKKQQPISGKIIQKVKGGYTVDVGLNSFMPTSQVDPKPVTNPNEWIGKSIKVMVLEMDLAKRNVLVSRRKVAEQEKAAMRAATLESIKGGQVKIGKVTGITKFGAFLDIGGVEGLLHVSDMSWFKNGDPQNLVKVGEELEVKILKYDPSTHRISLGRKQLLKHPWEGLEEKYPIGSLVKGRVTGLADFGAFVEIEPGVEGLIHVSELSWTEKIHRPHGVLKVGQQVESKLISIDREKEKISLSLRRTGPSPWESALKQYPVGSKVEGKITHLAPFGAFVRIPVGIEALLKTQDISWTERIQSPQQVFKVDDKIVAVVLEVNPREERMSLGLKQMAPDPLKNLKPGQKVSGTVTKVTEFGLFVKLESGLEGLVRSSEIRHVKSMFDDPSDRSSPTSRPKENPYKEGDAITAAVFKLNKRERKLELSIRKFEQNQERELLRKYSQADRPTLGETTGWETERQEK